MLRARTERRRDRIDVFRGSGQFLFSLPKKLDDDTVSVIVRHLEKIYDIGYKEGYDDKAKFIREALNAAYEYHR